MGNKKFNPWHNVSPGDKHSEIVTALIEIPRGSRAKYEVDKKSGLIRLDRVLYSSVYYPANYGFIPQTYCGDHDPLDILVLCQEDIVPMCLVEARVIGVMRMVDKGETDDKIIAVATGDPSVNSIKDISELGQHLKDEIKNFFESYKKLENREVKVDGFLDKEAAIRILIEAFHMYNENFNEDFKQEL